jgi:hypothetical protein
MAVGEGLEPVLSIYFTPGNASGALVTIKLSSGSSILVTDQETDRKTFKFSEIDVTASIFISYNEYLTNITTKNLVEHYRQARKPEVAYKYLYIEDVTQSASIVIE